MLNRENMRLSVLHFLFYGSAAAWMPFFNVYLEAAGRTGLQIGTLAGVRPVVIILSQPLWGVLADLRGRRRALLLTLLFSSFMLLGYIWGTSFGFLFGWTILLTLLSSPIGPLVDSLTLDHLEDKSTLSYGHFRVWGSVAWTVVAYAVGVAIADRDIRLTFVYSAILLFLGWAVAMRIPRKLWDAVSIGRSWKEAGLLLRNRKLVIFLVLVTLLQMGFSPILTFFPIYMVKIGASRQLIGFAAGLLGLSELPIFFYAAAIVRRIGHIRAIGLTFLIFSIRAFLYSAISQPGLATAVHLLHAPYSLFLLASVDYINQQVPSEWRATGQSLFWAANMGAAGILGNTLAGFLYDQMGVQEVFRISGFLILAVALVTMVVLREKPKPAE